MGKTKLSLQILELKAQNYSYNLIAETLGCSKGTVAYHCGTEQKDRAKARQIKNQSIQTDRNKKHKLFMREFCWRHKRLCGCLKCGIKDPVVLEYDHVKGEKLASISQMITNTVSFETLKEEVRKCDVLCANCHRRKTANQLNWFSEFI